MATASSDRKAVKIIGVSGHVSKQFRSTSWSQSNSCHCHLSEAFLEINVRIVIEKGKKDTWLSSTVYEYVVSLTCLLLLYSSNLQVVDRNRPDYEMDQCLSYQYWYETEFGKVKTIKSLKNRKDFMFDFYRLSLFTKDAIDNKSLNVAICFQAIGMFKFSYAS